MKWLDKGDEKSCDESWFSRDRARILSGATRESLGDGGVKQSEWDKVGRNAQAVFPIGLDLDDI